MSDYMNTHIRVVIPGQAHNVVAYEHPDGDMTVMAGFRVGGKDWASTEVHLSGTKEAIYSVLVRMLQALGDPCKVGEQAA